VVDGERKVLQSGKTYSLDCGTNEVVVLASDAWKDGHGISEVGRNKGWEAR